MSVGISLLFDQNRLPDVRFHCLEADMELLVSQQKHTDLPSYSDSACS